MIRVDQLAGLKHFSQLSEETEHFCRWPQSKLRRVSTVGCLRTVLKLLCLVCQTTAPQDLEETEHFRGWRQEEVAKIVHCGEKIEEEAIRKGGLKFLRPIIIERLIPHWTAH